MQIYWSPLSNGNSRLARRDDETRPDIAPVRAPPTDVIETKDALIVEVELPGHQLEDINVEIEGTQLAVGVERKLEPTPHGTYHCSERPHRILCRSFNLPAIVDSEKAHAAYRNGVLCVELDVDDALHQPQRLQRVVRAPVRFTPVGAAEPAPRCRSQRRQRERGSAAPAGQQNAREVATLHRTRLSPAFRRLGHADRR